MPTPPTGELITDAEYGPSIADTAEGLAGLRHYRVNTHDEGEALLAAGVPLKEDAWSASIPGLTCRLRETEYVGGTNDGTTGVGGWTRVRCEYSSYIDVRPLPQVGRSYTEIGSRTFSGTILYDVRAGVRFSGGSAPPTPAPPYNEKIELGKGASREFGGVVARISTFPGSYNAAAILNAIVLQRRKAVNDNPINLPPILKSGLVLALDRRQARYADFDVTQEAGLLKVIHTLELMEDAASYFWWTVSPEGNLLDMREARIYEDASFAGLW